MHAPVVRRLVAALITIGGAAYPVGYLLWSVLIPFHGIARSRTIAEWTVWIPFGGAVIVAMWVLTGALAWSLATRRSRPRAVAPLS